LFSHALPALIEARLKDTDARVIQAAGKTKVALAKLQA
jgi:hypothetical protein